MKQTIVTTLGQVDEILEDIYFDYGHTIPEGEDSIIIEAARFIFPELHLSARMGAYCNFDAETGDHIPDFGVTLIYEENEKECEKYIYWEQDDIATTLHNYLYPDAPEDIYSLRCIIEIEEMTDVFV